MSIEAKPLNSQPGYFKLLNVIKYIQENIPDHVTSIERNPVNTFENLTVFNCQEGRDLGVKWCKEHPEDAEVLFDFLDSQLKIRTDLSSNYTQGLTQKSFDFMISEMKKIDTHACFVDYLKKIKKEDMPLKVLDECQTFLVDASQFDFFQKKLDRDNPFDIFIPIQQLSERITSEIDMPFKVCLIKNITNSPIFSASCNNDNAVLNEINSIFSLLVIEVSPKKYRIILQTANTCENNDGSSRVKAYCEISEQDNRYVKIIIHSFLNMLNKADIAIDDKPIKVRVGDGKSGKRFKEFKNIMFVKKKGSTVNGVNGNLTWKSSHRFDVCGHWMMLPNLKNPEFDKDGNKLPDLTRIGKNRAGDYCVNGYTWKNPHVRGDDSLPYVKKTRIVK